MYAPPVVQLPAPMLATAGRPPDTESWAIEMKWDGVRVIVVRRAGICRLYSRNHREVTSSYPELVETIELLRPGRDMVLDGEVIATNPCGAPSFGLLQRRMHIATPSVELIRSAPVRFYAFDLLALGITDTTPLPYLERRRLLADLELSAPLVSTPPYWLDVEADRLLEIAGEYQLEGIVSKFIESAYYPGRRSPAWIKTPRRRTTEAIVAGWTCGTGVLTPTFGSLVLGAYDEDGKMVYIGNVGTGFSTADRRRLRTRLDELPAAESPFDIPPERVGIVEVRWVRPELVGDIEYREYTGDGLRHPFWRGLRSDKEPEEVALPR
ncbi:ATP-dependent DNA ligase [Nocardia donostiensis]|uniref:DNA ligase (ATP) n=1 Tax=Nocardia donostiensis TaxID=1538463 RepID=A0A1W0BCU6_9NOCA|nr:ATP-dependent DNA ligase [Nocardia donostiensis]OQS13891.1 ATP-dependent DNA ligase [Nocardia donostiensis]OQS20350.1 ATP-dependent DNA ligase [Nocardia donostiensis]